MPGKLPSPTIFDPTAKRMPVLVWYTTRYPSVYPWDTYPFVRGESLQSIKGECSTTRDILTQQNVSSSLFTHANLFHHGCQPVLIELSIASIPKNGKGPEVICLTVDYSNLLTTAKESRENRYINERLSFKSYLPRSVPLEYLSFCVRGKFCHLVQGNRGLIVVKGWDQRNF
ncbi:uncharacterized protein TNCV_2431641 [Trichonephila clavipes]|nr:uncharacterized protein TNCV_2431641 [Trichonephila clavipes]